jgi:pimeloyl-ACP methyl ester carboxylesterase
MSPAGLMPDPQRVRTSVLDLAYVELGPADGTPVVLLHGFPYDIHSYCASGPMLAERGFRSLSRICAATARGSSSTTRRAAQANRRP